MRTVENDACSKIGRRRLLLRAAHVCACCVVPSALAQNATPIVGDGGCFFVEQSTGKIATDIKRRAFRTSTGVTQLDAAVHQMLSRAATAFGFEVGQYPAFRFIPPKGEGGDGYATNAVTMDANTQGLVALSVDLLGGNLPEELRLVGFEVIMGHEFAHIYQARKNLTDALLAANSKGKLVELHSDFMAGWFMSKRNNVDRDSLNVVANALFSRGDNGVNEPGHHGTKPERYAAVLQGFIRGPSTDHVDGANDNAFAYLEELRK